MTTIAANKTDSITAAKAPKRRKRTGYEKKRKRSKKAKLIISDNKTERSPLKCATCKEDVPPITRWKPLGHVCRGNIFDGICAFCFDLDGICEICKVVAYCPKCDETECCSHCGRGHCGDCKCNINAEGLCVTCATLGQ